MSLLSSIVLALFLVGIAWIALVLRRASQSLAESGLPAGRGTNLAAVARFAESAHEEIGAYLAANYGGDIETLPGVLASLVDRLDARAQSEGLPLDRRVLKHLIESSAIKHKVARSNEVHAALTQVP
jgi:hypothetical protein